MKNVLMLGLTTILLVLVSCADPCQDVTCNDVGSCDDGTCICDAGYEGSNCETEARTKYLGVFDGILQCDDGSNPLPMTFTFVANPSDITQIDIEEYLLFDGLTGTLAGNIMTVPDPLVDEFDLEISYTFTSNDVMEMLFVNTNTADNTVTTCTGTFTRQ